MKSKAMKTIKSSGLVLAALAALTMSVGASAAFGSEFKAAAGGTLPGTTFTGKGGTATFETEKGSTVTCEKSESKGKILGAKEAEVVIKYTGKCTLSINGAECESAGAGKGNITTKALKVVPGTIVGNKKVRLQDFSAKGGATEPLAEFTCGGIKVKVFKSVICENTKPALGLKTTIICEKKPGGKMGEQKYVEMELDNGEIVKNFLEAEAEVIGIKLREKDSQTTTEEVTFSKEVEQTE